MPIGTFGAVVPTGYAARRGRPRGPLLGAAVLWKVWGAIIGGGGPISAGGTEALGGKGPKDPSGGPKLDAGGPKPTKAGGIIVVGGPILGETGVIGPKFDVEGGPKPNEAGAIIVGGGPIFAAGVGRPRGLGGPKGVGVAHGASDTEPGGTKVEAAGGGWTADGLTIGGCLEVAIEGPAIWPPIGIGGGLKIAVGVLSEIGKA